MNSKLVLFFHLAGQILAQTAVAGLPLFKTHEPIYSAVVAIVGVFIAFFDQTQSKTQ